MTKELIANFAQVEEGVWRGGQPTDAGWNYLKSIGVNNVVKLNMEREGRDVAAETLGMKVNYCPIDTIEQLLVEPLVRTVKDAVAAIENGKTTFVHCEHGQDRTGLIIGCYRVWTEGVTKALAWNEMLMHGFHDGELLGLTLFWQYRV